MTHELEVREIPGGITAPRGFIAAGMHCGIRRSRRDLAIVASRVPADVAAVFTLNKVQAAPILVNKAQLKRAPQCSAVVVNAGNANACTGERGLNDAWRMVRATAESLGIPGEMVMVASTGVIGQYLPIEKIITGIEELSPQLSEAGATDAAHAIMTTDTYHKELAVTFNLGDTPVTIGAMAKGSGMVAPNMATILGFLTTDAVIPQHLLARTLRCGNERSFNRISVDGDMSTNDMVMIMANGLAGNAAIVDGSEEYAIFAAALEYVLVRLAKMIARDGEGATKLIEVLVTGATSEREAKGVAGAIANSNLVKTAIHGEDANWGRIIAAVGYSGVEFDPDRTEIMLNDVPVLAMNYRIVLDEEKAKEALSRDTVVIAVDLNQGEHEARFWTCDLTKEYVHINASYRS